MSSQTAPNFHLDYINNQIWVALIASILFFVIAMPRVFQFTGSLTGANNSKYPFVDKHGIPTKFGLFVHAIVFFILFWIYLASVTKLLPNGY